MNRRIVAAATLGAVVLGGTAAAHASTGTGATRVGASERLMLRSEGGSRAHGTAVLTYSRLSRETKVVLTVTGLSKGSHLAHIHVGASCASNGAIRYPLNPLMSMGARSVATSTTLVHANVLHKAFYINVHGTTRSVLKVVACGPLGASPSAM